MKNLILHFLKSTTTHLIACMLVSVALLTSCESSVDEVLPRETLSDMSVAAAKKQNNNKDLPHQELARLRAAIARYHNIEHALADGYDVEFTGYRSHMGFHYLKPSLLDEQFEVERPEVLMYAPAPNGRLRLVGVEYAVPIADMDNPQPAPEGFTGDTDVWAINTEFNVWTLHVWVGLNNPNGIFAAHNPRLP